LEKSADWPKMQKRNGMRNIFVSQMLQKLQFAIGPLGQNRSAEWLHDLLHGHGLPGKLVLGRADSGINGKFVMVDG
jgi:hypothetical protein